MNVLSEAASALSDEDIVARVLSGEVPLFELLVRRHNQRLYRIVVMRFYGDLSLEEIATALSVSSRTIKRDLSAARLWLYRTLTRDVQTGIRPTLPFAA